jgi:hypothetical protein
MRRAAALPPRPKSPGTVFAGDLTDEIRDNEPALRALGLI